MPDSLIHTKEGVSKISNIKKEDFVLTHLGRLKKVKKIYSRNFKGKVIKIIPSCLNVSCYLTPEHPIYAIKSYKNCKNVPHTICKPTCAYIKKRNCKLEKFKEYKAKWICAGNLEKGDIILYPRYLKVRDKKVLFLNKLFPEFFLKDSYLTPKKEKFNPKNTPINNKIEISKEFCRLIGYYLAEGYVLKDRISFTFNKREKAYIKDIKKILRKIFGKYIRIYEESEKSKGYSFSIYSKILSKFFRQFYSSKTYRAFNKKIPAWIIDLPPEKQKELVIGWWRGDKGYTTSEILANQIKIILLRLGIIPYIRKHSYKDILSRRIKKPCFIKERKILATKDCYHFSNLSFFENNNELLNYKEFKKFKTKINRRKCWLDENFFYLPITKIESKDYKGKVFNLEVEDDNSYISEALAVHNCWTPWFGVFGSKSGFDSLKEAFQDQVKHIHAIETGLSSDPPMNWRLKELDSINLVSFSDAHSFWPWRIGREATVFEFKELTYDNLIKAIRTGNGLKETVEFFPEGGKYHFDGHRNCGVCFSPEESKKHNLICPVCKKPLTLGVEFRVEQLATRHPGKKPDSARPFKSLIPLMELISAITKSSVSSQKNWKIFYELIKNFGNEFNVLLNAPIDSIKSISNDKIADYIERNRNQKIKFKPGFDGEYGKPLFEDKESQETQKRLNASQKSLNEF